MLNIAGGIIVAFVGLMAIGAIIKVFFWVGDSLEESLRRKRSRSAWRNKCRNEAVKG